MEFLKMLAAPPYSLAVMAVGTEEAGQALGFDMQLARRYEVVRLERWTFGNEFRSFLNSWNANIPLALDSKLDTPKISKHILKITKGQMDLVVKAIRWAAIQAIVTGEERITIEMIDRGWENRWYYQANED
ncbi:TniB protein [Pseudomonas sp. ATCC 13867]|nr:TniB protein [Pseudomonas sp. ATCC 13867]RFQ18617.1 transposase [Pseudomonas sp. ATCC 13867]